MDADVLMFYFGFFLFIINERHDIVTFWFPSLVRGSFMVNLGSLESMVI